MTSLARLRVSNANTSFIAPSSGKNGKPFSTSENKNKTMMTTTTMMMGNSRQVSSHRGHRRGRGKRARAAGSLASSSSEEEKKLAIASEFQLSPLEPSSAVGTHLKKVLERDPNRFEEELDKQLRAWVEERELDKNTNVAPPSSSSSSSSSIGRMNTIEK